MNLAPLRTREESHRPLGDATRLDVYIGARLRFADVFLLHGQSERLLGAGHLLRKLQRLLQRLEGVEVVAASLQVRCTALRVAPDPVLQHGIPHVATSRLGAGWVGADK